MDTTRLNLNNLKFKRSLNGYSCKDVDKLMESISISFNKLYSEVEILKSENKIYEEKIEYYRSIEVAISNTMVRVEINSMELIGRAYTEANRIIQEAHRAVAELECAAPHETEHLIEAEEESQETEHLIEEESQETEHLIEEESQETEHLIEVEEESQETDTTEQFVELENIKTV